MIDTNILLNHIPISLEKVGKQTLKFTFDTGREFTVNYLIWSTIKSSSATVEPTSGSINFFQGGAVTGPGIFGHFISVDTPLTFIVGAVPTVVSDIDTAVTWLLANLNE